MRSSTQSVKLDYFNAFAIIDNNRDCDAIRCIIRKIKSNVTQVGAVAGT